MLHPAARTIAPSERQGMSSPTAKRKGLGKLLCSGYTAGTSAGDCRRTLSAAALHRLSVFAVTDPKVRKIFAPAFTDRLRLELHPNKTVLQRSNQGIDFLGCIVYPGHRLTRQRSVRALRRRLAWFKWLVWPHTERHVPAPPMGVWQRWLANHQALRAAGVPSPALLQRMLATLNSYYGVFSHADTYRLRKHIYHKELGPLKRFFLPDGPSYHHLQVKKAWQQP